MNFIQKNYETLLTKMEIAHIHEDNRKDFDELEDALLDIAECMRLVAERALEKVFSAVDTERAAHYSELHKGCPGWDKALHAPARINALCAKYDVEAAFCGAYDWRRHGDELLEMLRALILE